MSLTARKELLERIRSKYQGATWSAKNQILTAFSQATGYRRKVCNFIVKPNQDRQGRV
jgi:hypothetical protein